MDGKTKEMGKAEDERTCLYFFNFFFFLFIGYDDDNDADDDCNQCYYMIEMVQHLEENPKSKWTVNICILVFVFGFDFLYTLGTWTT